MTEANKPKRSQHLIASRSLRWALFGICTVATIVLYDWGPLTPEYFAFYMLYGFFIMVFVLGIQIQPTGEQPISHAHSGLSLEDFMKVRRILFSFGRGVLCVTLITATALLITILGYQHSWSWVTSCMKPVVEVMSILVPLVGKMPGAMADAGFQSRFELTQAAAAVGHAAGLIWLILSAIFFFRVWRLRKDAAPFLQHLIFLLLSPILAFFILGAVTYVIFVNPDVRFDPQERQIFGAFETSDLSLFWRMLIQPAAFLGSVGAIWGGFFCQTVRSTGSVFRQTKNAILGRSNAEER